ncbi:MAG: hypothetical protein ACK40L_09015, partial [Hydrogenophaga sp.]
MAFVDEYGLVVSAGHLAAVHAADDALNHAGNAVGDHRARNLPGRSPGAGKGDVLRQRRLQRPRASES